MIKNRNQSKMIKNKRWNNKIKTNLKNIKTSRKFDKNIWMKYPSMGKSNKT